MPIEPLTPHQVIFAHPIDEAPYNLLRYVGTDLGGTHLYAVHDLSGKPVKPHAGAYEALKIAQEISPARCWYCPPETPLPEHHRDHVIPRAHDGRNELHNLVIACPAHNTSKRELSIMDCHPYAGRRYMEALHAHISRVAKANAKPL